MKRRSITVLTLLGLLLAIALGPPYWIGLEIRAVYQSSLPATVSSDIQLTPENYTRGWFTSEAVTGVRITVPETILPDGELRFSLQHQIHHGLLPIAWWLQDKTPLRPVLVGAQTTLAPEPGFISDLLTLYQDREPLVITSSIDLNTAVSVAMTAAPLELADVGTVSHLQFLGLKGQFRVNPNDHAFTAAMTLPGLRIVMREGELQIKGQLSLRNSSQGKPFDLPFLLRSIREADMEMAVSQVLLESKLSEIFKERSRLATLSQGRQPQEEQLIKLAGEQTQQQLLLMKNAGFISLDEDSYRIAIHFDRGRLVLNGREREPAVLIAMLAVFSRLL